MIASRSSCSPLSISANCNFSTSCSIAARSWATSSCIASSGSSSNNPANPCRSFNFSAMLSQVVTSSCNAFSCCICACALRLSAQQYGPVLLLFHHLPMKLQIAGRSHLPAWYNLDTMLFVVDKWQHSVACNQGMLLWLVLDLEWHFVNPSCW